MYEFNYMNQVQEIHLTAGLYKITCYGAKGGTNNGNNPYSRSNGGYSEGFYLAQHNVTLYVCVGKAGGPSSDPTNGYNGGGSSPNNNGGGGATHIAISNHGTLSGYSEHELDVLLVAGGGGGAGKTNPENYGHGGGLEAGPERRGNRRATQSKGYAFGQGQNGVDNKPAGGGGWYGGYSSDSTSFNAGGGSGFCNPCLYDAFTQEGSDTDRIDGYATIERISDVYEITVKNSFDTQLYRACTRYPVRIELQKPYNALKLFQEWACQDYDLQYQAYNEVLNITSPGYDITIEAVFQENKKNTNIDRDIFGRTVFRFDYLNVTPDKLLTPEDVVQENHGLHKHDVVCLTSDGKYERAIAIVTDFNPPVGIIADVYDKDTFTLVTTGAIPWTTLDCKDTTILYLSDTTPGALVQYQEITSMVYVPVAVYTNNRILIRIEQGSTGSKLAPYSTYQDDFEKYTKQELDDIIAQTVTGVM